MITPITARAVRHSFSLPFHDPASGYLTAPHSGLQCVFAPESVAIVGATDREGSVGKTCVANLMEANEGKFKIYPVNPSRKTVSDMACFPNLASIPGPVDLALIVTPSHTVPKAIKECGEKGIGAAIVISAGFKELGADGLKLENEVIEVAHNYSVRVLGPNCLGIMCPNYGLNATFAACAAKKGNIAFMSQSGAMCTAVLDWSMKENIGFSAFVSIGSMADVNWGDLIDHLGNDPETHSILIYMETIGNASAFLSAAKEIAPNKPIIVIKAGKSAAAAKAAASHTGSLAGAHDAFLAAMRRVGVLTVDTIGELFNCALALGKQPRPKGPNLLIITNAGGPGVLATDAVTLGGGHMAELPSKCIDKLNAILPPAWSHGNPVDVLGDASPALYAQTLGVVLEEDGFDGVLVILSPQSVTDPTGTAKALLDAVEDNKQRHKGKIKKPILASWMGGKDVTSGFDLLNDQGIPTFAHPDDAARTFASIWKQTCDLELMTETPGLHTPCHPPKEAKQTVVSIFDKVREAGRELLTEAESKDVLKAYDIPIAETIICATEEDAAAAGKRVKFPCVVKLNSETITHKSDVGGVKLNILNEDGVKDAFRTIKKNVDRIGPDHFKGVTVQPMLQLEKGIELIMGSVVDPQFGPLVIFGSGGCMVEIFKDSAMSLPPLNATLAARQMEETKIFAALKGGHGERFPGCNLEEINVTLVRFSQMICELSEHLSEIDINPLLALPDRLVSLDARIVLRSPSTPPPVLTIKPYPRQYVKEGIKLGTKDIVVRPAHANDFERFARFHKTLSQATIRQRYLADVSLEERLAHQKVVSVCCSDYSRLLALLAVGKDADGKEEEMYGICRLTRFPTRTSVAELKLAVRDDVQGCGLGREMIEHAVALAKEEKLDRLQALVFEENTGMLKLLDRSGFSCSPLPSNSSLFYCFKTF